MKYHTCNDTEFLKKFLMSIEEHEIQHIGTY